MMIGILYTPSNAAKLLRTSHDLHCNTTAAAHAPLCTALNQHDALLQMPSACLTHPCSCYNTQGTRNHPDKPTPSSCSTCVKVPQEFRHFSPRTQQQQASLTPGPPQHLLHQHTSSIRCQEAGCKLDLLALLKGGQPPVGAARAAERIPQPAAATVGHWVV